MVRSSRVKYVADGLDAGLAEGGDTPGLRAPDTTAVAPGASALKISVPRRMPPSITPVFARPRRLRFPEGTRWSTQRLLLSSAMIRYHDPIDTW